MKLLVNAQPAHLVALNVERRELHVDVARGAAGAAAEGGVRVAQELRETGVLDAHALRVALDGLDDGRAALLHGGDEFALEPGLVRDHVRHRLAVQLLQLGLVVEDVEVGFAQQFDGIGAGTSGTLRCQVQRVGDLLPQGLGLAEGLG